MNIYSLIGGKHGVAPGSGSSRRKPVAPQWFNPSWHDDSDDDNDQVINGVCVFQNAINYSGSKERLEPNSPSEATKPKPFGSREGSIEGKSDEEGDNFHAGKVKEELKEEEEKINTGADQVAAESAEEAEKPQVTTLKEEVESDAEAMD
jgi:hypothetical protein